MICALAFLGLNDVEVVAKQEELVAVVLGVAEGRADKAGVAVFLRANTG